MKKKVEAKEFRMKADEFDVMMRGALGVSPLPTPTKIKEKPKRKLRPKK